MNEINEEDFIRGTTIAQRMKCLPRTEKRKQGNNTVVSTMKRERISEGRPRETGWLYFTDLQLKLFIVVNNLLSDQQGLDLKWKGLKLQWSSWKCTETENFLPLWIRYSLLIQCNLTAGWLNIFRSLSWMGVFLQSRLFLLMNFLYINKCVKGSVFY